MPSIKPNTLSTIFHKGIYTELRRWSTVLANVGQHTNGFKSISERHSHTHLLREKTKIVSYLIQLNHYSASISKPHYFDNEKKKEKKENDYVVLNKRIHIQEPGLVLHHSNFHLTIVLSYNYGCLMHSIFVVSLKIAQIRWLYGIVQMTVCFRLQAIM